MIRVLIRGIFLMAGLGLLALWLNSQDFFDRKIGQSDSGEGVTANVETSARNPGYGLVIDRSGDGFFYVDAWVNGDPVYFLVDTGASHVVLTRDTAYGLGFDLWDEEFNRSIKTAGGETVRAASVILDEININDEIVVYNVRAMVLENGDTDLLGMSFLAKVDKVTVEDDQMVLEN